MSINQFANDPEVRQIDSRIAELQKEINQEEDAVRSWDILVGKVPGFDQSRANLKALQGQLRFLNNTKQEVIRRRQASMVRTVPNVPPSQAQQRPSYGQARQPTPSGAWRPSPQQFQPETALFAPSPGAVVNPSFTTSSYFQSPGFVQDTTNGYMPHAGGVPAQVYPVAFAQPASGGIDPFGRPVAAQRFGLSGMNGNASNLPSGVSTPSSQMNVKRNLDTNNSLDLTSPGRSKRPRGFEDPSPAGSATSSSRPVSRASTGSSIIDLTGDDNEIRASIATHKETVARRQSNGTHLPQRTQSMQLQQPAYQPRGAMGATVPTPAPGFTATPAAYQFGTNGFQNEPPVGMPGMPGAWPTQQTHPTHMTQFGGYVLDSDEDAPQLLADTIMQQGWQHQPPPQQSRRPLSEVIAQTSPFAFGQDLLQVVDGDGFPYSAHLPPRAARVFHDVDESSHTARESVKKLIDNLSSDLKVTDSDTPEVMKYPLYKHQMIALKWMQQQEQGSSKGGILADDMGLGKTISMLALIVSRPPVPDAEEDTSAGASAKKNANDGGKNGVKIPFSKTNLIVLPKALIRQWQEEIETKLRTKLSVYVFHGSQKVSAQKLMQYDVVLTTYQTLLGDYVRLKKFWENHEGRNVNLDTDQGLQQEVCFFHPKHAFFYRIILDESQYIKNEKGKTSLAAAQLAGRFRWCMSGTPMMNNIKELYPLFRFLRIEPYNKKPEFQAKFRTLCRPGGVASPSAMRALQVVLKCTMLRRSKNSQLDGKPIIVLPEKTEEEIHVELQGGQLQFYQDLAKNARITVNEYLRKGTLGKHYTHMLEMLLRLRQACCHPHLIDGEEAQPDVDDKMLKVARSFSPEVIERIKHRVLEIIMKAEGGFECPVCYDTIADPSLPLPCGHPYCHQCLNEIRQNAAQDNMRDGDEDNRARCPICREFLGEESVTLKAFKRVHMPSSLASEDEKAEEDDSDESDESDSEDDENADDVDERGNLKDFVVDDEDDLSDVEHNGSKTPKTPKGTSNGKGKSTPKPKVKRKKVKPSMLKHLRKEGKKNFAARRQYMRYLKKNWMSSAKVDACMELLRRIQTETDGEKTIIFSQWTMLLDFLEVALAKDKELEGVGHVRFDGEMSMPERDIAVKKLRDDKNTKIMLVSLKAGNAGLNLVSASRVIILDPFWNPYIEKQAVDRAHRIGQLRKVKVYRILVSDTVEDQIMSIKQRKEEVISSALDEGVATSLGSLSSNDIRALFGIP